MSQEHMADLRSKEDKNSLVKHWSEVHGERETPPSYEFKVKRKCKTAIERQIWEALLIRTESENCTHRINQKGEFGINIIPKMSPTMAGELVDPTQMKCQNKRVKTQQPEIGPSKSDFELQYSQRAKRRRQNKDSDTVNRE